MNELATSVSGHMDVITDPNLEADEEEPEEVCEDMVVLGREGRVAPHFFLRLIEQLIDRRTKLS